jgi:nucleotide-binding universal stress UspA family protein
MFKHVLVPLDGSELSEKALAPARHVLAPDGTLTLLSVIDLPNMNQLYDTPINSEHESREDELSTARKNVHTYLRHVITIQNLPPTVTIQVKVCIGNPASIIPAIARALHVDVIVMSTHGRSGLSRWMFGSITQHVLGQALCPVVVVPGQVAIPTESPLPEAATPILSS